jgi:hypothetical protein
MKIELKKINVSNHELRIIRSDKTFEQAVLDTKTYLLHDICHFYVEKELQTVDGFWGMLSQGYQIEQLFGKTNQLTEKLRIIECVVGGTQSVYSNHLDESGFWTYIEAVDFNLIDDTFLEEVIPRIADFMSQWKFLSIGNTLTLIF